MEYLPVGLIRHLLGHGSSITSGPDEAHSRHIDLHGIRSLRVQQFNLNSYVSVLLGLIKALGRALPNPTGRASRGATNRREQESCRHRVETDEGSPKTYVGDNMGFSMNWLWEFQELDDVGLHPVTAIYHE